MAGSASVIVDGSLLSRIDQTFLVLEKWLALVSGVAVFSLMALAVVSVGGRNFFNSPLPGYVDWIEQAMPLIAFMGVAYVQREGGHIRMDILVGALRGRALWIVEFVTVLAMLLLMLLLAWGSYAHFERSFELRRAALEPRQLAWTSRCRSGPPSCWRPVAFSVLCLRLALQLVRLWPRHLRTISKARSDRRAA